MLNYIDDVNLLKTIEIYNNEYKRFFFKLFY